MSGHTPGPWNFSNENNSLGHGGGIAIDAIDPADHQLFEVCEVWGIDDYSKIDSRAEANARLIAAAPELLEALQGFVGAWPAIKDGTFNGDAVCDFARAAIAKATGAA